MYAFSLSNVAHDDITAVTDAIAAGRAKQFPAVQFPVYMVFDIHYTCAQIPELYTADEPNKAIAPERFPFFVLKDPKAVSKAEPLESSGVALVFECACHGYRLSGAGMPLFTLSCPFWRTVVIFFEFGFGI